jgi:hypothetical protein
LQRRNPEREDSPTYLLKRLKQLEHEYASLHEKKRSRPEDAASELKELVIELKHKSCAPDFLLQCTAALDRVSALIEDAPDRGSTGQTRCSSIVPPGALGSHRPPTPHAISTRSLPPSAPRAGPQTKPRS